MTNHLQSVVVYDLAEVIVIIRIVFLNRED